MAEWIPDAIYRQLCDELLTDPLPAEPAPAERVADSGHSDWFTPGLAERVDGWCEDRDPQTDLTDTDGRE